MTAGTGAYDARTRALLHGLTGTVLEIGAGYGANFPHFRAGVDWLGLEPDRRARRHLTRAAAAYGHRGPVIAAPAEDIPLDDASVDAVVATLVLCSVTDQDRALAEVRRVLRPGGIFVFAEHVAAPPGTWSRRLQQCWAPFSRRLDGCDPARDTWRAIQAAGFHDVDMRWFASRGPLGVHVPLIAGTACTGPYAWEEAPVRVPRMTHPDPVS